MTIASRSSRARWDGLAGTLVGIVVASIALVAGVWPIAATGSAKVPSTYGFIPAQISMRRPGLTSVPSRGGGIGEGLGKKMATSAKPQTGLTPEQQKRVAEVINRMTPKEGKRLAKAVKRMTPEQRKQFVAALKQQLAKRRTAR